MVNLSGVTKVITWPMVAAEDSDASPKNRAVKSSMRFSITTPFIKDV